MTPRAAFPAYLLAGLLAGLLGARAAAAQGRRVVVPTPVEAFAPHAGVSPTLYLERCIGGCAVQKGGMNDARAMVSTLPARPGTIDEFVDAATRQPGAAADADWAAVVQCVREVYSPFAITVTDVRPPPSETYHLAVVAGVPENIGFDRMVLGIAPLASNCAPQDNVMSFSFANAHGFIDPAVYVDNVCWTVAQESAHAFGLDHQFQFLDDTSACNDPMTYRVDCGGQKFFRNRTARCGEDEVRACRCGATQNSHKKLLGVFGPGAPITPAPTVAVTSPVAGGPLGASVVASAGSQRGVAKVELVLNGYPWVTVPGAAFGPRGQPEPSPYLLLVPAGVPDGVIDVVVRASDDLGQRTDSPAVTVTRGAPCTSAASCLPHQRCEEGRCFWEPTGELGDACTESQLCKSHLCSGTADHKVCTIECVPDEPDECPGELTCVPSSPGRGICFPLDDDGGCCSAGRGGAPWGHVGAAGLVLGLALRRRRGGCARRVAAAQRRSAGASPVRDECS